MNIDSLLRCKQCGNILIPRFNRYICNSCSQSYLIEGGIILMEGKSEKEKDNLRIGDNVLNIQKLRNERKYFNSTIKSNVEYFAHLHSINFVNFHAELLSPYISDLTVIVNLGCGQLPFIGSFANFNIGLYHGLDLDKESLKIAKENSPRKFPLNLGSAQYNFSLV